MRNLIWMDHCWQHPATMVYGNFFLVQVTCSRIWDSFSGQCLKTLQDDSQVQTPPVTHVTFAPNGKYLLSSSLDNKLKLWNYQSGHIVKTYEGHSNSKHCLISTFFNGSKVVSGSEDGLVYVWDVQTRKVEQKLQGHDGNAMEYFLLIFVGVVFAVHNHPSLPLLATGAQDKSIRIWQNKT